MQVHLAAIRNARPTPRGAQSALPRNYLFDVMRGLAALIVAAYHFCIEFKAGAPAGGYLAVDFFFVLSGYIIARVYEAKLAAGLGFADFAKIRFARLYPSFFVGSALGVAWLASTHFIHGSLTTASVVSIAVFNALMLPARSEDHRLFPSNYPAWSLFAELVINLIYAAALFRIGSRWLAAFVVACCLMSVAGTIETRGGINAGLNCSTLDFGLARTGAAFGIGVLIARHRAKTPESAFAAPILVVVLLAALLTPVAPPARAVADYVAAYLLFSAIVWVGATVSVPIATRAACAWLGEMSYPLYCLHVPAIMIVVGASPRLHLSQPGAMAIAIAMIAGCTIIYTDWIDRPARRWLGARLGI